MFCVFVFFFLLFLLCHAAEKMLDAKAHARKKTSCLLFLLLLSAYYCLGLKILNRQMILIDAAFFCHDVIIFQREKKHTRIPNHFVFTFSSFSRVCISVLNFIRFCMIQGACRSFCNSDEREYECVRTCSKHPVNFACEPNTERETERKMKPTVYHVRITTTSAQPVRIEISWFSIHNCFSHFRCVVILVGKSRRSWNG